jgi:hypothetical protein
VTYVDPDLYVPRPVRLTDGREVLLTLTCAACPTQYDVMLTDGRQLYFRYRFAHWRLHLDGPAGPSVGAHLDRGHYDGWLDDDEVRDILAGAIPELLTLLDMDPT